MSYVAKSVTSNVPDNRWVASLSNGETIFEDKIEGKKPAWTRLKQYVKENNLQITQLRHQITRNKSHCGNSIVKKNADGYVQLKKVGFDGYTVYKSYGIGYIENGEAYIIWQREDGMVWQEKRSLEKCGFGLILNE